MGKIFTILNNNGRTDHEFVEEQNLEKVLCYCHGNLRITDTEITEYDGTISHRLECQKCKGAYTAQWRKNYCEHKNPIKDELSDREWCDDCRQWIEKEEK